MNQFQPDLEQMLVLITQLFVLDENWSHDK